MWAAREALQGVPFAVINADDFYGAETFIELMKAFSTEVSADGLLDCAMVGFRLSDTPPSMVRSPGAFADRGRLFAIGREWSEISGSDQVSGKNPAVKSAF